MRTQSIGRAVCERPIIFNIPKSEILNGRMQVKLYTAVDDKEGSNLHRGCPSCLIPIKQNYICVNEKCDTVGPLHETVSIYMDGDTPLEITEEDLNNLKLPTSEAITIHSSLNRAATIELLALSTKSYFVVTEWPTSLLMYAALVKSLSTSKTNGLLVKFTIRSKRENLGVLYVNDDVLMINVIPFAASVRKTPVIRGLQNVNSPVQMKKGITDFIQSLPINNYEEMEDAYDKAFADLISSKVKKAYMAKLTPTPPKKSRRRATGVSLTTGNVV